MNGTEELNQAALNEAYKKRLALLHSYIQPETKPQYPHAAKKKPVLSRRKTIKDIVPIPVLVEKAKKDQLDIVRLLRKYMPVDEVKI